MNQMNQILKAYESNRADAPAFWQVDILWMIHASGEQTGNVFSLMEELCPKDSGPPPHYHDQDESFYLLDGEITFLLGDEMIEGKPGAFIFIPRGTIHSFRVDSETARILNWYTPAGFERTVIELGEPAPERVLPPKGHQEPVDQAKMKQLFAEIGMHPVDAPDRLRDEQFGRKKTD